MLSDHEGDTIYNGAVDDGIGCGILLELARAYAMAGSKPPHAIVFAALTAEEKGLLGSDYLARHPPVPAGNITLDLNFDVGLQPLGIPTSLSASGADRTTFYPTLQKMAAAAGLALEPDANPGAGYYFRADHFSFARAGIPAFSIGQGVSFAGHSRDWGIAQRNDYVQHRYHQPSDEFNPAWDFSGIATLARFAMKLGWAASAAPTTVSWQPGDALEKARQASLTKPGA
jgi:Zn-dependent M28 family amino/carboxypeptidase